MPEAHSLYSASRFEADMLCPGRRVMEAGRSSPASIHSARGTVAHTVLEAALKDGFAPSSFIGQTFKQDGFDIEFDDSLCENVEIAAKNIREMTGGADIFEAESRVNYARWLEVPEADAWGTADIKAVHARYNMLDVHDFKNGYSPVPADTPQLKLYGGGALLEYEDLADIENVRLVIHQPEVSDKPIVHELKADELKDWLVNEARPAVVHMRKAAERHGNISQAEWEAAFLKAGEKQCKYCAARADCATARTAALEPVMAIMPSTADEFAVLDIPPVAFTAADDGWLGTIMDKADMIEDWLKAVRAEVERRLLAGAPVQGYKIVQGKRGNRAWVNTDDAEATLKTMRLKQEEMYQFKLITPTAAEKLAKAGIIGKRQWPKLQAMITQSDGKPHVAPESDARPALMMTAMADQFEDVVDDIA